MKNSKENKAVKMEVKLKLNGTDIAKPSVGESMKKLSILTVLSLGLVLTACNDQEGKLAPQTGETIFTTRTEAPVGKAAGPLSGGGGFADTFALEALEIAKLSLAQIIRNTSDEIFVNLPEGKQKKWIAEIIESIEFRDTNDSRYDRPLKFNYDLEEEKIYATKYFFSTFPYGRFDTRADSEKTRILNEVSLDILHELSHFYGIGVTEQTDYKSENWAKMFITKGLNEVYACNLGPLNIAVYPSAGLFYREGASSYLDKKYNDPELLEGAEVNRRDFIERFSGEGDAIFWEIKGGGDLIEANDFEVRLALMRSNKKAAEALVNKFLPQKEKNSNSSSAKTVLDFNTSGQSYIESFDSYSLEEATVEFSFDEHVTSRTASTKPFSLEGKEVEIEFLEKGTFTINKENLIASYKVERESLNQNVLDEYLKTMNERSIELKSIIENSESESDESREAKSSLQSDEDYLQDFEEDVLSREAEFQCEHVVNKINLSDFKDK